MDIKQAFFSADEKCFLKAGRIFKLMIQRNGGILNYFNFSSNIHVAALENKLSALKTHMTLVFKTDGKKN